MSIDWLLLALASVNVLAWICVRPWLDEARAHAFRAGLVMGRELDGELLDRIMREAGIDPATLPERS